ncbi:MAG TPA: hypothetical protein VGS97_03085 [Actinocrinis sp.]|uniref:hypothetical protein n=1 Tax=Actinocrinis sp. TaxID=1920516 RepID=UPI002DDD0C98|nr:hypothetical protein [Actinocrinis sp.]HEV2343057.1 hypothetical protein [Actinocrinis sp.]
MSNAIVPTPDRAAQRISGALSKDAGKDAGKDVGKDVGKAIDDLYRHTHGRRPPALRS